MVWKYFSTNNYTQVMQQNRILILTVGMDRMERFVDWLPLDIQTKWNPDSERTSILIEGIGIEWFVYIRLAISVIQWWGIEMNKYPVIESELLDSDLSKQDILFDGIAGITQPTPSVCVAIRCTTRLFGSLATTLPTLGFRYRHSNTNCFLNHNQSLNQ